MKSEQVYNHEILKIRDWVSKIPESKKAVMLLSGGYDSIITSARLIKDFNMELFPIYFDRGARNREAELQSISFYTQYIQNKYGKNRFHNVYIPKISIPPLEIKQNLQDYAKTHSYPMRDVIMLMYAVQYAASLGKEVRTICNGMLVNDFESSLALNRINTLSILNMTNENDWNILSINMDTEICQKTFRKRDEILWAKANDFNDSQTITCWTPQKINNIFYHCGKCSACLERKSEFAASKVLDKTLYVQDTKMIINTRKDIL